MLQTAFQRYINNYKGFTREVWILAIVTFINRAGTMVLPFLTLYLKEDLKFDYGQISWVMVAFGFGSMIGSWIGGKLSDKIGFYRVMIFALFTSGLLFFVIRYITSFSGMCAAMFAIMLIADMFRPAMFVSLSVYAKPENRTRAFTLVRSAVNLGMSGGPAIAGLIIMGIGYKGLFWADGITCITAILIFVLLVKEKKKTPETVALEKETQVRSVYKDHIFLVFLFVSFVTAMVFFQIFTTFPLYQHEQFQLTAFQTGLLTSSIGIMVFFFEMPIVGFMERHNVDKLRIIFYGSVLMAISMLLLLLNQWAGILIGTIIFITFGQMLVFPFSNSFAINRAPKGHEGRYMALYTMSFSLAHILSAKTGLELIDRFGYQINWVIMGSLGLVAAGCVVYLMKKNLEERHK